MTPTDDQTQQERIDRAVAEVLRMDLATKEEVRAAFRGTDDD